MNFRWNEKLTLLLLIALAFSVSSLSRGKDQSRDFASVSADTKKAIENCVKDARANGEADCSVEDSVRDKVTDNKKASRTTNLHITISQTVGSNGKQVQKLEGQFEVDDTCDCGATAEGHAKFSTQAGDLQAVVHQALAKLTVARNSARDTLKDKIDEKSKKEKLAKDKKSCAKDDDGDAIADNEIDRKLACFQAQTQDMSDSEKQKYAAKYVDPYFQKNIEPLLAAQLQNGDPRLAKNLVDQLGRMNLSSSINGKLGMMDSIATIKAESLNYRLANEASLQKYAAALSSTNPNIKRQAQAALNNELNNNSIIHFNQLLAAQNTLGTSLQNTLGSSFAAASDPMMGSLLGSASSQLSANIQSMVNSNKQLSQTLGPNFANSISSGLGTSLPLGNSLLAGNSSVTDPLLQSFSLYSGLSGGLNSLGNVNSVGNSAVLTENAVGTDVWNSSPANGSNAAAYTPPPQAPATIRAAMNVRKR